MKPDERRAIDNPTSHDDALERALVEISRSIKSLRFGSVEITIHDSRVVQIERKEKLRFAIPPPGKTG